MRQENRPYRPLWLFFSFEGLCIVFAASIKEYLSFSTSAPGKNIQKYSPKISLLIQTKTLNSQMSTVFWCQYHPEQNNSDTWIVRAAIFDLWHHLKPESAQKWHQTRQWRPMFHVQIRS